LIGSDNRQAKCKAYFMAVIVILGSLLSVLPIISAPTLDEINKLTDLRSWDTLSIGDRFAMIGMEFLGVPYVGGTLERAENEVCSVLFHELDCVTFVELVLNLSRSIDIYGYPTIDELKREVTFTRYRGGELDGYTSRLHYTSDWIDDNVDKMVLEDITQDLGGIIIDFDLNFMSTHREYYPMLVGETNEGNLEKIKLIESFINNQRHYYIPKQQAVIVERLLKAGDIIAITSRVKGLDYNHIGMIFVDEEGTRRLLHASLGKKKVVLDKRLSEYLKSIDKHTGITVLRPLKVSDRITR